MGKNETGGDLAEAVSGGNVYTFVVLDGIECNDMAYPESTTRDGGVEDAKHSCSDGAFGGIIDAKWDE